MREQLKIGMVFSRVSFMAVLVLLVVFGFQFLAQADTLYLKNGRKIEGVIVKDNHGEISLEVICGVMKFPKEQIESVKKSSSAEEVKSIQESWEEERKLSDAKANERKKKQEGAPKEAEVDKKSGQITVETMLNKKVKATLMLDTGASLVVLSSKVAASLGLDQNSGFSQPIEMTLADGRKITARSVVLDSVSVQGSELEKVEAAVLPEQENSTLTHDGLLGMSFLKKFNFKIDQVENKLVLEKL